MGLTILALLSTGAEAAPDEDAPMRALVCHAGQHLEIDLIAPSASWEWSVDVKMLGEWAYEEILSARLLPQAEEEDHGFFAISPGQFRFVGRVHNILELDDDDYIVDLYCRQGPEFLTVESSELEERPAEEDHLELRLRGLTFYPSGI